MKRAAFTAVALLAAAVPVRADGELLSKLTASAYFVPGDRTFDLNLRHKFGDVVAWAGDFVDPKGDDQARIGAEYDLQRSWLLVVPTVQVGSNGLLAGQLYSEWGTRAFAIAGYSRTNLKPFYNLSWDPNESVQVGLGVHLEGEDRLFGFTIVDVRLHTKQQDTHVLWRHRRGNGDRVTLDALYKSGHADDGSSVHAAGIGVSYDRHRTFLKAFYDPHVNFGAERMIRLATGWRF